MPLNYFQNQTVPEVGAYGQQLGQALSQGMMQIPQQRLQLAMQLKEMQNQQQQRALMMQLSQQKQQELDQYRQGLIGVGQQNADTRQQGESDRNDYNDTRNQLAQVMELLKIKQAEQPKVEGGQIIPGIKNFLGGLFGGNGNNSQQTNDTQSLTPTTISVPPRPPAQITQNQLGDQFLKATLPAIGAYGPGVQTNNPALWNSFTNFQATGQVPQGWGGQQPQQGLSMPQQGLSMPQQQSQTMTNSAPQQQIPPDHIQYLQQHPESWQSFEQHYGQGSSAQYLP